MRMKPKLALEAGLWALCVCVAQGAQADEATITGARQAELLNILEQDCGSCHGLTLKGGLGPPLTPVTLKDWDTGMVAAAIYHGIPDTPMPPWQAFLNKNEALWLAQVLKTGDMVK